MCVKCAAKISPLAPVWMKWDSFFLNRLLLTVNFYFGLNFESVALILPNSFKIILNLIIKLAHDDDTSASWTGPSAVYRMWQMVNEQSVLAITYGFAQRWRVQMRTMRLCYKKETTPESTYGDKALLRPTICLRPMWTIVQDEASPNSAFGTAWQHKNLQLPVLRSGFQ